MIIMNYWWINANAKTWNWTISKNIGELEEWQSKGKAGKTKPYFKQAKEGDLVFCYNSGMQREIVAIAEITKELYVNDKGESVIGITKIKDLKNTISRKTIEQNEIFKNRFSKDVKLRGTILPLSKHEFYELLRLI